MYFVRVRFRLVANFTYFIMPNLRTIITGANKMITRPNFNMWNETIITFVSNSEYLKARCGIIFIAIQIKKDAIYFIK